MRRSSIVLLFASFVLHSEIVLAKPMPDIPEKQIQEVLKTVQLSPDQKTKVRQIRETGRVRIEELRDTLEKRRVELNQTLDGNGEDEAVRRAFQNLQDAKRALETARFERMLAIRGVMTEPQRQAFLNLRQNTRRE